MIKTYTMGGGDKSKGVCVVGRGVEMSAMGVEMMMRRVEGYERPNQCKKKDTNF